MAEPGVVSDPARSKAVIDEILSSPEFAGLERHWYSPIIDVVTDPTGTALGVIDWFLFQVATGSSNLWVATGIAALFVVLATVGVVRLTRTVGSDVGARLAPDFSTTQKTAEELDADADVALSKGRFVEACRARFTALLLRLEAREVLELRQGRTTGEYGAEVASKCPAAASSFEEASAVFNKVWFSGEPVTHDDVQRISDLAITVLREVYASRDSAQAAGVQLAGVK